MIPMQRRNAQMEFAIQIFASAWMFWLGLLVFPEALGAHVYGEMAQSIQAEAWASGFMGASLLLIYGVHINGRWRWSPFLRIAGLILLALLFAALALSSFSAPAGVVIWAFTIPCFLFPCLRFLRLNVMDARARWRNARNK